jgi:hypothetical protein
MAMSIQIVMQSAQATGALPEAVLAIEHREAKTPGEPTKKFVVPVLRFADSLGSFMDQATALPSGPARSLPGAADGGEGEGTVQSLPEPSPIEPTVFVVDDHGFKGTLDEWADGEDDEVVHDTVTIPVIDQGIKVTLDDIVEEAKDEGRDEMAWTGLLGLLEEDESEGTMQVVEGRIRRLFRLMSQVRLWTGEDALHAALAKKHNVEHVGDLRKNELNLFAEEAFTAARKKVADE